jgi:hypothetical protein
MYKRLLIIVLALFLSLKIFLSLAYAIPDKDSKVDIFVWPRYWQTEEKAKQKNNGDWSWANDNYAGKLWKPFYKHGCLVTSLSMLFSYYGLSFIPDKNHYTELCSNTEFSTWCSKKGKIYSDTDPGNLNKWLTDNDVYLYDFPYSWGLLSEEVVRLFWRYRDQWGGKWAIRPNFSCYPVGTNLLLGTSEGCYKIDWTNSVAQQLLDEDLKKKRPAIMKIKWQDKDNEWHDSHFVLIGGYDWDRPGYESYRAYDPNQPYNRYDTYPPGLKWLYSVDNKQSTGRDYQELRVDRFTGDSFYFEGFWKHVVTILGLSPIELQVTNPDGKTTGYNPDTGSREINIPKTSYSEESEPSTESDSTEDPVKVLFLNVPSGNYILKIYGTGEGDYTVKIRNIGDDAITELEPITGTASQGMTETYRLQIPDSGEITFSNSNQSPTANAGSDQTGEQSYEITLDGSGSSDPDGDPLKYSWSFVSKPSGSTVSLSDSNSKTPTFTPDLQGTYTLQLVVNDYFTDSSPSTVTITVTPIQSRISVTPNFSAPLNTGSSNISFDLNNIGRLNVSSGLIDMTLKDPDGNIISTGSKTFSLSTGQSTTLNIPVTIPSLKFGNYSLTYTQSDETRTGSSTTTTVANSVSASFTFDKTSYKVRETVNLTLDLTNTGKFDLDSVSVSVSLPDAAYTDISNETLNQVQGDKLSLTYAIQIPETATAGQHDVNVTLTLPSGSTLAHSSKLIVPESSLTISYSGSTTLTAGDTINLKIENTGGVDTSYTTEKLSITDSKGVTIYSGNPAGTIQAGQIKTLTDIQIPSDAATGSGSFDVKVKDSQTGNYASFTKPLDEKKRCQVLTIDKISAFLLSLVHGSPIENRVSWSFISYNKQRYRASTSLSLCQRWLIEHSVQKTGFPLNDRGNDDL